MNILVLTQTLYTSDVSGLAKRLYPFLKWLKKFGYKITIISFYKDDNELKKAPLSCEYYDKLIPVKIHKYKGYLSALKAIISGKPFKLEYFNCKDIKKALYNELKNEHYDILYAHYYKMAQFIEKYTDYKRVVDLCDAISLIYDKQIKLEKFSIKKLFHISERNRVYNYEKQCIKKYDKCLYIAETDRIFMAGDNSIKTAVIANGVDTEYFYNHCGNSASNEIIFIGAMSTIANHDAVVYFIKNIYPIIKNTIPNIRFKIIGINPKQELLKLAQQDRTIIVTGEVDDMRIATKNAHVSVAPMRIGAGIQNKILEAMSMGIPTVTTPFGADGITDNEEYLLIAQNDLDFADKVIKILSDKEYRHYLSDNSRNFCENNFSWQQKAMVLSDILSELG